MLKAQDTEDMQWDHLDNNPDCKPTILRDLKRGIPRDDNTYDIVFCSHVLEHFGGEDFTFILSEIHRVLKPNGELQILSPYYKHFSARSDPHHKIFLDEHSFEHWWYPSLTSQQIGVNCYFFPVIVENAEDSELRVVMRKVPNEQLNDYVKKISVEKDGRYHPPNFKDLVAGRTYYGGQQ